jgi:hypothetical protein
MQGREKPQKALFGTQPMDSLLPGDHPLRKIRALFDEAFRSLEDAFETSYGSVGNVSVPPAARFALIRSCSEMKHTV